MDQLNINNILERNLSENKLIDFLEYFEKNKKDVLTRRGIYIYGGPGSGKTQFVKNILKKLNYDIIVFDAGDVRNKTIIDNITKNNMSDTNIISMFKKEKRKIAILMDEIDGMNGGDKGGINSLIKLIRPKKTKKQKQEETTMIPIICIGNYHIDKKITEMMKVCSTIEIKTPTTPQIEKIIKLLMPTIDNELFNNIVKFIQGDLRKVKSTYDIYANQQNILKNKIITTLFQPKTYNEDTKQITKKLINNSYTIDQHNITMNETDRTSVALLFHENIIDVINKIPSNIGIPFYMNILNNICFADYIDRITFQKQIWIFNEMSSLIKTFYNNKLLSEFNHPNKTIFNPEKVRFTKVLTKYSTEYNNMIFIQTLCEELNMDRKDMLSYFISLKNKYKIDDIYTIFDNQNYNINKLDINRIYRYLENYVTIE
jgi:replication factor C subunit 1